MEPTFDDQGDRLDLNGDYAAVVFDNEDPRGLGRIRATIDGIVDQPATGWLYPAAMGAGPGIGAWMVPEKGSDVVVRFFLGNPDEGYYYGGSWPTTSVPAETEGGSPRIWVIARKRYAIILDDKNETAALIDRETGGGFRLTRDGLKVDIGATADLSITAGGSITIDAPVVTINGRDVLTSILPIS
jgi:hypothetical protein